VKKLVCIIGTGHCGSTLLDLIIGSHSEVFSLGELIAISSHMDNSSGAYPRICSVCRGKCTFWNEKASWPLLQLYYSRKTALHRAAGKGARLIYSPYHLLSKWSGKNILVDSSKKPSWYKRQLQSRHGAGGITPYLIFITRDGRAVVNSYLRKYPERGIETITKTWLQQVNGMNNFYEQFEPSRRMKVKYEELASRPETVAGKLCEFLGIPYEKAMLTYWVHDHHLVAGNAGTNSLIWKYREMFSAEPDEDRGGIDPKEMEKYFDKTYYDQVGMGIRLDERWRQELGDDSRAAFDALAGEVNRPFIFD
jgi:hypothetical protein